MTLTDFLLARIAEDEAVAQAMRHFTVEDDPYYSCPGARPDDGSMGDLEVGEQFCGCGMPQRRARVLAECEAKRRIVGLVEDIKSAEKAAFDEWGDWHDSEDEHPSELIVRILAVVYADHADYREEWRP